MRGLATIGDAIVRPPEGVGAAIRRSKGEDGGGGKHTPQLYDQAAAASRAKLEKE